MAILVPKKMETKKLMAYSAIIVIMVGGIIFFILKMRSSTPLDIKKEPASVLNEPTETELVAPDKDSGTISEKAGGEKIKENLSEKIFTSPQFKALRDNSLD
jgi:hypothetical protein